MSNPASITWTIIKKVLLFICLFTALQVNRELIVRPIISKYIGPIKTEKHLYLDKSLSNLEAAAIVSAAQEWEEKTDGIVTFKIYLFVKSTEFLTIQDEKAIVITKLHEDDALVQQIHIDIGMALGFYTRRFILPAIIFIPESISDIEQYRQVALHELGHSIGMDHQKEEYSLMYPYIEYGSDTITRTDLNQFCEIYYCNPAKLANE